MKKEAIRGGTESEMSTAPNDPRNNATPRLTVDELAEQYKFYQLDPETARRVTSVTIGDLILTAICAVVVGMILGASWYFVGRLIESF